MEGGREGGREHGAGRGRGGLLLTLRNHNFRAAMQRSRARTRTPLEKFCGASLYCSGGRSAASPFVHVRGGHKQLRKSRDEYARKAGCQEPLSAAQRRLVSHSTLCGRDMSSLMRSRGWMRQARGVPWGKGETGICT